ncbi:MAG: class I SAM-dependent RNA methyltransferase, partial [Pseudomonadota bacterium]
MCGSGTFLIEAAEIAAGLAPGRLRPFAFERLANHDASGWNAVKRDLPPAVEIPPIQGFDRDPGAIAASTANIERAGFGGRIALAQQPISALTRPPGRPGLVIVNPPYGSRIGNAKTLRGLYATLGKVMMAEFAGWRAAIVTSAPELARATGLPFRTHSAPIPHGGLRVSLWQTGPLG